MEATMKRIFTCFGSLDDHLKELLRGATTAASLKIVAAFATFSLHLMLGRTLGPEGSGVYFLAFTIVTIAATLARFGLDNTLVRFIAAGEAANQPERVRGVYRLGVWITATISCVLGGLLCTATPWLATSVFKDAALVTPLQIMTLAIPPFALFVIHAQALQGLKRIRDAIATLSVISPILTALMGFVLIPVFGVSGAVSGYVVAAVITLLFGVWRWKYFMVLHREVKPRFDIKELLESAIPLFWVAAMNMLIMWVPTLILGAFGTSYDIGLFSAANRTAMLVSFVLIAVNSIAAPKFAALHQEGNIHALRLVAKSSTRIMIAVALPALIMFLAFPGTVMSCFGKEFQQASFLLQIMGVGQFINVATGSVGFLLIMTGRESKYNLSLKIATVLCISASFVLIPHYGALGAAISTAVTVAAQNVIAWNIVRKFLFNGSCA